MRQAMTSITTDDLSALSLFVFKEQTHTGRTTARVNKKLIPPLPLFQTPYQKVCRLLLCSLLMTSRRQAAIWRLFHQNEADEAPENAARRTDHMLPKGSDPSKCQSNYANVRTHTHITTQSVTRIGAVTPTCRLRDYVCACVRRGKWRANIIPLEVGNILLNVLIILVFNNKWLRNCQKNLQT